MTKTEYQPAKNKFFLKELLLVVSPYGYETKLFELL